MSGVLLAAVGNSYGYKPINTVAPAITGTAQSRQTLTCSTGTWNAAPLPITYSYQWQKNGSNISGATNSTYVVLSADVGSTLRCVVTATNAVGATSANSNTTATVIANVPAAPTIGTATATGSSTATVAFTPPADNGGAAITGYTVTSSPGGITASGTSSPITVTGLLPATSYTFTVRATNSVGTSAASASSNTITTQDAYWIAETSAYGPNAVSLAPHPSSGIYVAQNRGDFFRLYNLTSTGAIGSFSREVGGSTSDTYFSNSDAGVQLNSSSLSVGGHHSSPTYRTVFFGMNSSGNLTFLTGNYLNDSSTFYSTASATDSSGNVYGQLWHSGVSGLGGLIKYNSSGTLQYLASYGFYSRLQCKMAANTSYVVCMGNNSSWGGLVYLNASTGDVVWATNSMSPGGGGGGTTGYSAAIDSSNNAYGTWIGQFNGVDTSAGLFKYNSSGTLQWGLATTGYFNNATVTFCSDGFLYLIGQLRVYTPSYTAEIGIVKISTSGSVQWSRNIKFGSSGNLYSPNWACATVGSSLYVGFGNGSSATIIKVPTDGSKTGTYGNWTYSTSGPGITSGSLSAYSSMTSSRYNYPNTAYSPGDTARNLSISTTVTNM